MNITKKMILIFTISIIGVFALSCENKNTSEETKTDQIKRAQLENIVTYGAIPQLKKSIKAFEDLSEKATVFKKEANSDNLKKLKESFRNALLEWKSCEIYNIGKIREIFLYNSINFPVDEDKVENKITKSQEEINEEFISKQGSPLRSISTVEYLIYNKNEAETIKDFKNQPRRGQYLEVVCKALIEKNKQIKTAWENYADEFTSPTDDILEDGHNLTVNALVSSLEFIKNIKLGDPLGDKTGKVNAKKLEAYRSKLSLGIIKRNIEAIEMMFNGNYPNSKDNIGFDDYFKAKGESDTVKKINSQINKLKAKADDLSSQSSLYELLIQNNTDKVRDLQKETTNTLRLIKAVFKNITDTIITPNDTDGD